MSLRENVTQAMFDHSPIPQNKADSNRRFYYARYEDNLFCPLGTQADSAYNTGSGKETQPKERKSKGKVIITPAKMASIASSSAMTFNLLGNDPVTIAKGDILPSGLYKVQYEEQLFTVCKGSNPANLDAFLSDESNKTAIFCEMKTLEWLGNPSCLKDAYLDKNHYFVADSTDKNALDAYQVFNSIIKQLISTSTKQGYRSIFKHYDVWQMLKHLLSIYNYTSFTTQNAVNKFSTKPSMAGKYDRIILANVVNEFPPTHIKDAVIREKYVQALNEERNEAKQFIDIINNSEIAHLFDNNCHASVEIKYLSAKDFADTIDMSQPRRTYLKRYFN